MTQCNFFKVGSLIGISRHTIFLKYTEMQRERSVSYLNFKIFKEKMSKLPEKLKIQKMKKQQQQQQQKINKYKTPKQQEKRNWVSFENCCKCFLYSKISAQNA